MNTSSTRQSRGLKRWPTNKGDDPENSIGADKQYIGIR